MLSNRHELSASQTTKSAQKIDEAITSTIHEAVVISAIGFCEIFRLIRSHPWLSFVAAYSILSICLKAANERLVVVLLYNPHAEHLPKIVKPILHAPWEYHFLGWLAFFLSGLFLLFGLAAQMRLSKYRRIFEGIRLTTGNGDVPTLVSERKLDKHRQMLEFDSKGIGMDRFREKIGDIEASFGKAMEAIAHGENQSRVKIILTSHKLPEKITYEEISNDRPLPENSFYIGQSIEGIQTQCIVELPHMLIAGATGGGKSVFFKQVLVGLMESTKHLQLYALDLKGGLEMADFAAAPNVKVVKEMSQAVALLASVEKEMRARFKYLEANGYREIDTVRDKRDRIIIAVDESSVLFTSLPKSSKDYQSSIEARRILDSLSKLSRAAGINIILATQKLDKQVLPTQVSENISGRMAFKANSVPGSAQVIYTRDAADLPEIKGRGIWLFGSNKSIVQAPFITEKEIKSFARRIKIEFSEGKRQMQSAMLTFDTQKIVEEQKSYVEENFR